METACISIDLIKAFQSHLVEEEHCPATIEKYLRDVKAFFAFLPSEKRVSKEAVLSYKQSLSQSYKASSANSMLVAVNRFLSYLGLPGCRVKLLRIQRTAFRDKARELGREEYKRLVHTAKTQKKERLMLLLQAVCCTGIRVSEHRFVTVEALQAGAASIVNKGKIRTVLLPPELRRLLLRYCRQEGIQSGPVFVTRSGHPLDRSNIWKEMKSLCQTARVASCKVFPHNLRHLFALTFYRMKKDIVHLADILGHTSIETTRIYTSASGAEYSRAISRLGLLV